MSTNLLDSLHTPTDLRELPASALPEVAAALREEIVTLVARSGGHLASSLGAVELLVALHYVFDTPRDRLVLDVGHQGYAHKMLTGRREGFARIGKEGGTGQVPAPQRVAVRRTSAPATPARRSRRRSAWRAAMHAPRRARAARSR